MKIALVTSIFGSVDTPKLPVAQSVPCDYFCFTEANTPVPLPNLPDRLKAKYFKLQMHRVLPGYDAYVWIDGNIEVINPDFMKAMAEGLDGIRIQKHHERKTIGEEIDFILKSENPYLTARYGAQPLKEEFEWYLKQGMPEDAPLYSCNIFSYSHKKSIGSRNRTHLIDDFFANWILLCIEWSWFDQSAFCFLGGNYAGFNELINPVALGPMFDNPYFILHPHAKALQ